MDDPKRYKEHITQIKVARGKVKASLTRLEHSADELESKNEVVIRLQRLEELLKEFEKLDSELTIEDSEIEEFENRYFSLKLKFQNKIDVFNTSQFTSVVTQNSSVQSISNFRLPKLTIPVFSGKFEDWMNFKDLFVSTVHSQLSLSNSQKFQYLKGLLSNEPASLIKLIPLSNDSYEEAWGKLMDRYDKKKKIINALIKTFLEQKGISQANSTNLRNIVDTSDEVLRGLKSLGEEASSRDPWLIHLLLQKLDPETRRLWSVKTSEIEFPTWEEFLEFLNTRCSSLELMVYNESDAKIPTKSNFVACENIQRNKSDKNCLKCSGMHKLFKCIKFRNMDLNARKNFVKRNYLCFLCLNSHKIKDCTNSHLKCTICKGNHNSLLHEDVKRVVNSARVSESEPEPNDQTPKHPSEDDIRQGGETQRNKSVEPQRPVSSSTCLNNSKFITFLPTAKVLLYNSEGDSFLFRALLDSVENINIKELDYLKGIPLSDEDFSRPSVCDLILGSDCFFSILRNGKISGSEGQPIAQSTIFGWVVSGQIRRDSISSSYTQSHLISVENDCKIDSVLQKFWQMEELSDKKFLMSDEEEFCENHFKSTCRINDQGRFVVRLPVYKDINQLGDTKGMAISRLLAMERKFKFNSEFEMEYKSFMREYEELGHMSPNKDFDSSKPDYFLPHHAVQKKNSITTKFRVVFDGSCKPPNSTRCLHQIGLDSQIINPEISKIIQNSFYMDDLMAGAKSNEEAIALIQKLSEILDVRGFHLRKWRSNSPHVLNNLAECLSANESNVEIHPENCSKTLGLIWNSLTDCFVFKIDFNFENEITKRSFLSQSARLFDPLGFLSPCTILIKIFYQQLWLLKLDWDSALPEHFAIKWRKYKKEFQQICHISIPRWLLITEKEITLHGFSDASESAYACVIYAVQRTHNGVTKVTISAAKSKVAALKLILKLFFPGCLHLLEIGSPLLPTGRQRSWTSSLKIDGDLEVICQNKKIGDIAIIKEDNIPPATWPLGKVVAIHPGRTRRSWEILQIINNYSIATYINRGINISYISLCTYTTDLVEDFIFISVSVFLRVRVSKYYSAIMDSHKASVSLTDSDSDGEQLFPLPSKEKHTSGKLDLIL
ncbi:hypothetical protein HNY73_011149 [Argiope bruennichi]|uniref:Peptidase aspartic putative domain-containing protein n=1 Tax=Argiope bruennichi TaxID=94029 RepID=A0A8T0F379_ARGBR|nr:hypothetical protein HNY73_011149 [Argiope bruennichi]